jgi:DNA modification methylase
MTPWLDDGDVRLYHGDNLDVLRELPDKSIHMCCTSPPFYGLRDYGTGEWEGGQPDCDHQAPPGKSGGERADRTFTAGTVYKTACGKCGARRVDKQIGLEETPDQWVQNLVRVFREVRRILRDDGTLWIEIGDSFVSGSVPVQPMWGDGRQAWSGEGDVPSLLPPTGPEGLDGEEPRARAVEGSGVPPEAPSTDQRPDHRAQENDASGDHGEAGREVPVLRGDGAGVPDDRPRPGRRSAGTEASSASRPQDDSGRGLPAGQVPDPLLELQLREAPAGRLPTRLAPKNLLGQPWRLAFALQADGWILRSEIIWSRPNPMPESVTDRPTKSHSTVFLLSKQPRYFYDADAIREPLMASTLERGYTAAKLAHGRGPKAQANGDRNDDGEGWDVPSGANARSVWQIPTQPTPFAHFATWPEALCRRMILAGTSERGCCPECGAPWVREVERPSFPRDSTAHRGDSEWANGAGRNDGDLTRSGQEFNRWREAHPGTVEWKPSCACCTQGHTHPSVETCAPPAPVPCTVLDPFAGSGTTMLVARHHGRHSIGIELNEQYLEIAAKRLQQLSLLA